MKRMTMIKTSIAVGALLLISGGGYVYAVNKPVSYQTAKAEWGSIHGEITETGTIEGEEEKEYFAGVTAPVSYMDRKIGDSVSAGEVVLTYDADELNDALTQASLYREQSEKNYDGRVQQSNQYTSKYNKAQADDAAYASLYAMQREDSQELSESQYSENYSISCTADGLNKKIAEKSTEIVDKTQDLAAISDNKSKKAKNIQDDLDDLNIELSELKEQLASLPPTEYTPAEYASANDKNNVMEDISRNWQQAKTDKAAAENGILNDSQKEALETETKLGREKEKTANKELEKAQNGITADFNGIITSCNVKAGAYVTEGTPLFTIESSDRMKAVVKISKYDIGKINIAQKAKIDISGKLYDGTVSKINKMAITDNSDKNKIEVEISLNQPDEQTMIGIEGDVTIYTQEQEHVILIPYEAYYSDDQGDYCYVIQNGKIEKNYFTAGIVSDEFVECMDGIDEGTVVITDAVTDAKIGEKASESTH